MEIEDGVEPKIFYLKTTPVAQEGNMNIEYATKLGQKLAGLNSIKEDLTFVKKASSLFKQKFPKIYSENPIIEEDATVAEALFKSIVITYARCFNSSNGRTILNNKYLIGLTEEQLNIHNSISNDIRNGYVAHAGDSHLGIFFSILEIDKQHTWCIKPNGGMHTISHSHTDNEEIQPIVDVILKNVSNTMLELENKIALQQFPILRRKNPQFFGKKYRNNEPITDEDLK